MQAIGADDYTNREYFGGDRPVELYIGYYKDQRSGDAIHSPKNCLPGAGWEPVRSTQLQIGSADKPVLVNEYIVEKGKSRDLVLYWYQTHGRIVASEYWAKFWLVADGVRHRSTDGAMIRIWTTAEDGEAERSSACGGLRSSRLSASLRIPAELIAHRSCDATQNFSVTRIFMGKSLNVLGSNSH